MVFDKHVRAPLSLISDPMRLSQTEIHAIKQTAQEVFGAGVEVILFGSRTDDSKKGGDIDLYIKGGEGRDLAHEVRFQLALERKIGEQKIDVIFAQDSTRFIEQEAMAKGIVL